MLIDGEKWACEACVRGHRVSNCQHADRPLQHINKKGRPVSQCQHCRSMRKSRSSHVKCDCGEKTHKCIHLQQTMDGHKEAVLDTVPESESDQEECKTTSCKPISRRRRTNTAHSEPVLSFDENGHHKPTHKHIKASQQHGPYTLNRVSSMHSNSSSGSLGTRSMDNLHCSKASGRSRTAASTPPSDIESDLASPGDTLQQLNGQLPPLDLSSIRYPKYTPSQYPDYVPFIDLFSGVSDGEQPIFSAGLSAASVDWAQYDGLELRDGYVPSSFGQAESFPGFELPDSAEPTLASNSGDVSETEDFLPSFGTSAMDSFRNSAAGSFLDLSQSQASMLSATDLSNLEYDEFKGTAAASKLMAASVALDDSTSAFAAMEDDGYWSMNNFNDGITQSPDPVASGLWDSL
ncbi:uncharacterized protein B0I36DRAFT_367498 [Microdochium trichocladiopsis]|uniref:Copper-fist domain-containing protein n=1 Tax=Microdochium trichocladiopsis TaxID=1682393 RepID=A0A9P8XVR9_9PEZI|nr:uncharacterized protein B0I36DRAFT_367498 [Microdochium trichocladiopsis]KAH7021049.1 hypothetical protein B0I36DRAFT_367498 [Microdochium trichocladiopsis]